MRTPDSKLSKEKVEEMMSENLSPHNELRGGIEFVEIIPRSVVGKIRKKEILKQFLAAAEQK